MVTRASKKKSSLEGGAFNLADLGLGDDFVTAKDYDTADVDDFVPTGMPSIDAALTGGIPMGRITEIYSAENVGKTTFVIQVNRMANELGIPVVWFDVETTNGRERLEKMGVDMQKTFMYKPKKDEISEMAIEKMAEQMERLMTVFNEQGTGVIIVVDSVGQSIAASTAAGNYDDKQPGRESKAWSAAMYKLQPLATKTNSAIILINQVRENIGAAAFGDKTSTPGGRVLKHAETFRIKLDKTASKTLSGEEFGHITQLRLVKSKLSQPRVKVKGIWMFGTYGFNESINLLLEAKEQGLVKIASGGKKGNFYKVPNPETGEIVEIYEKELPYLISSGEIEKYTSVFAELENKLSEIYFPEGHPALNNKHFKLSNSELFSKISKPEQKGVLEGLDSEESDDGTVEED